MTSHLHPHPRRYALYVHVPFCVRKCPYCAFISQELKDPSLADAYVAQILREAAWYAALEPWVSASVHSLYLGGGTPSLLGAETVLRLLKGLRDRFRFTGDAECSIEVNPGTMREELLDAWSEGGINRISLGVQSLGVNTLHALGRIHTAEQARESWRMLAGRSEFRWNVDLMYGIVADRGLEEWAETLAEIETWRPEHLSAYSLIVEEGTPFAARQSRGMKVRLADDDEFEQMDLLAETMTRAGLEQYEVSNWARVGMRCRHNLSYWDGGSYLSLGPAGHSYDAGQRIRFWNLSDTMEWMRAVAGKGNGVEAEEQLTPLQHLEERIMLTLRLVAGGRESELAEGAAAAGVLWPPVSLVELIHQGMLRCDGGNLRCTRRGLFVADEIQARLAADLKPKPA